ncbi:MAG: phosphopantothenoylcysteine decarboxylase [Bdellovibrionota bacterium]
MIDQRNRTHYSQAEDAIFEDVNVEKSTSYLDNFKVTVVSGGGIAAVEVPRLVRELRRHGATTQICATENALKFVGLESLRWASQNEVVINPSGLSEHICTSDIVVVVPATADLLSKIKNGICSDGATTLIQSAFGAKKTVIFCQTMHDSLASSPIIMENISTLEKIPNVFFIKPRQEEGKQKIPPVESFAMDICHIANMQKRKIKDTVLITLGGTRVMLDPVRCITNLSTGNTGIEVAKLFYGVGYKVQVLAANTNKQVPTYEGLHVQYLPNYQDMFEFACHINPQKFAGLIHLVAASDFVPEQIGNSKIKSNSQKLTLNLTPTKKLLTHTQLKDISYKAAAKLTTESQEEGLKQAVQLLTENNLNAVLWNTAADAWNNELHAGVFLEKQKDNIAQTKLSDVKKIAQSYLNSFEGRKAK